MGEEMKLYTVVLLLLVSLMSVGCTGAQAVVGGSVTDVVTNVEPRKSGTTIIWVRTDITSGYCTKDPEIVKKALEYKEYQVYVTIEYKSLSLGESDTDVLGLSGCDPEGEGIRTYRLISFRLANIETTKTPPWSVAQ